MREMQKGERMMRAGSNIRHALKVSFSGTRRCTRKINETKRLNNLRRHEWDRKIAEEVKKMTDVEKLAKALYIEFGFRFYKNPTSSSSWKDKQGHWHTEKEDEADEYNSAAAKKLWETGKYRIVDYGGYDFDFTCTEKDKREWITKAKKLLEASK